MANFAKNLLFVNQLVCISKKMMTVNKFQKKFVPKYLIAKVEMAHRAVIIAKKLMLLAKIVSVNSNIVNYNQRDLYNALMC